MLHMVINTHHPESCAFRSEADAAALLGPAERFEDVATARGAKLHGSWINRASHEVFILVESDNAHLIDDAIVECGLVGRTYTRVVAVISTDDVEVTPAD